VCSFRFKRQKEADPDGVLAKSHIFTNRKFLKNLPPKNFFEIFG
jgi:hypothetical protein